jgi:hypothetical protein
MTPTPQSKSTVDPHFTVVVQIKETVRATAGFVTGGEKRQVDDVLSVTTRADTEAEAIDRALTMLHAEADRKRNQMELP